MPGGQPCSEALSAASTQWLADRGPGALVAQIRAPTLLMQGTLDTLFRLGQAVATYTALRANGVPVKMLWYCGGHGTCATPAGDPSVLRAAGLTWLRRWLKRDTTVDTGPRMRWIDDGGDWRSGPTTRSPRPARSPRRRARARYVVPTVAATLGETAVATPPLGMVETRYAAPAAERDIVGEPSLTLTYSGLALPSSTFLYAQVVDIAAGRVVGNQVTPIPVVLDGLPRTVTRQLEVIAMRARRSSDLRLQIVSATPVYGPQRSAGWVTLTAVASSLPVVDATQAAAPAAAQPSSPLSAPEARPGNSPLGGLIRRALFGLRGP